MALNKSVNQRSLQFDFLKSIGILCIILAHTMKGEPNSFLYQLRNFDVPLMVMVSGTLFWLTSGKKNYSFWQYLRKRIPRLILPVWCFFTIFFILSYFIAIWQGKAYPFHLKQIIYTYILLIGGVGYVWIIRVFLLIAAISPLIVKLKQKFQSNKLFLLSIIPIYIVYTILLNFRNNLSNIEPNSLLNFFYQRVLVNLLFDQIILLLIPYTCIFMLGMALVELKRREILLMSLTFFTIFLYLAFDYYQEFNTFIQTQTNKYPPQLYYLSYSIALSLILYVISQYLEKVKLKLMVTTKPILNFIVFLSSASLWIYLWHVFYLYYWKLFFNYLHLNQQIIPEFLIVTIASVLTVFLQRKIVYLFLKNIHFNQKASKIINMIFMY